IGGSQLFTEHTATAVYPVLDEQAHLDQLAKLWIVVLLGNIIGAFFGAVLLWIAEDIIQGSAGYSYLSNHLLSPSTLPMFGSSVLAGCLMAFGGWLILSGPPSVAQMAQIYLVTFIIGL